MFGSKSSILPAIPVGSVEAGHIRLLPSREDRFLSYLFWTLDSFYDFFVCVHQFLTCCTLIEEHELFVHSAERCQRVGITLLEYPEINRYLRAVSVS